MGSHSFDKSLLEPIMCFVLFVLRNILPEKVMKSLPSRTFLLSMGRRGEKDVITSEKNLLPSPADERQTRGIRYGRAR